MNHIHNVSYHSANHTRKCIPYIIIRTFYTVVGYYSVSSKVYTLVKQLMNALLIVAIPRIANELTDNNDENDQTVSK